jgi:hypothetical protein
VVISAAGSIAVADDVFGFFCLRLLRRFVLGALEGPD